MEQSVHFLVGGLRCLDQRATRNHGQILYRGTFRYGMVQAAFKESNLGNKLIVQRSNLKNMIACQADWHIWAAQLEICCPL